MEAWSRSVAAQPLDDETWSPFGWLPVRDTDPRDGAAVLHFEWGDAHVNVISHAADEVPSTARGLVCEKLFRHETHTQALLVLNCEAVIAVAPADRTLDGEEDLGSIRAFLLRRHDGVVLDRGTWHWGPFPLDAERVDLFNVQGRRYAEDNACARLADAGLAVEIVASARA